jgi:hypothetical protein
MVESMNLLSMNDIIRISSQSKKSFVPVCSKYFGDGIKKDRHIDGLLSFPSPTINAG